MRRRNHVLSSAEDQFAGKQAPRFVGSAVVQVYSPVVYLVDDLDSQRRTKVFVNDLKKHTPPRNTPTLQAPATAQNFHVVGDGLVGRGVDPIPGDRPCRTARAPRATTADAAPGRAGTRPQPSTAPSTIARVGHDLLPPRRRGSPPRPLVFRGGFDTPQLPVETRPLPAEAEGDQGRPIQYHCRGKCAAGHPWSPDLRCQAAGTVASSGTAGSTATGPLGACITGEDICPTCCRQ